MSKEDRGWTYTANDKVYSVEKFNDEGEVAFTLLLETDKELAAVRKTAMKLEMALRGFNTIISEQLTDDMVVEDDPDTIEDVVVD
jgi:hypothetical protein|tara:strand:+ start:2385 stop:2639 length:255 start_codon:yes stop_codon:yes gene_type:complete